MNAIFYATLILLLALSTVPARAGNGFAIIFHNHAPAAWLIVAVIVVIVVILIYRRFRGK